MDNYTKDKRKLYNEKYYEKKKDRILNELKEKVYCSACKCDVNKSSYTRHFKSTKHKLNKRISDLESSEESTD